MMRFTQITAGAQRVFALDDEGRVWAYLWDDQDGDSYWYPLLMEDKETVKKQREQHDGLSSTISGH